MRLRFTIRDLLWLAVAVAPAQFVDNRPLVFGQSRWVHGLRLEFYLDVIQIGAACIRNLLLTCRCNDMCDASKRSDIGFKDCQSVGRVGDDHSHFHFASCDRRWDGRLLKPGKLDLQSLNCFTAHFSESWHFLSPYEIALERPRQFVGCSQKGVIVVRSKTRRHPGLMHRC